MKEWVNLTQSNFEVYYQSFIDLTENQTHNFEIKKNHSYRVADLCAMLAAKLEIDEELQQLAYIAGLLHDIGRFRQLIEFGTFNDAESVDHAQYSMEVIEEKGILEFLSEEQVRSVFVAIENHNKKSIAPKLDATTMLLAQLLRDADKLDILKVLTDYYSNPKVAPNHTLTWEMPGGIGVSPEVAKQVLAGKLVSKENVKSQADIKVMQLSWVYDLNFKPSFDILLKYRYLDKIYNSMTKSDTVIEIYRKVKVFAENKVMG